MTDKDIKKVAIVDTDTQLCNHIKADFYKHYPDITVDVFSDVKEFFDAHSVKEYDVLVTSIDVHQVTGAEVISIGWYVNNHMLPLITVEESKVDNSWEDSDVVLFKNRLNGSAAKDILDKVLSVAGKDKIELSILVAATSVCLSA